MLKYEIALCSVWWCAGCENIRYFESVAAQTAYFEELTSGLFSPLVNFNIGNNVETTIYYRDTSGRSTEALIACNYAVIRHKETPEGDYIYRYFFARCSQDSGNQMRVELSLDDIQTNYFRYKDTIAPCIIERAHLNRWKDPTQNIVEFDDSDDSPLFLSEGNNHAKRVTEISRLQLKNSSNVNNNRLWDWLNEKIAFWIYIFMSQDQYNVGGQAQFQTPAIKYFAKSNPGVDAGGKSQAAFIMPGFSVMAVPILKNLSPGYWGDLKWRLNSTETAYSLMNADRYFIQLNSTAKIYSYLISHICPFPPEFTGADFSLDGENLIMTGIPECADQTGFTNLHVFEFATIQMQGVTRVGMFINNFYCNRDWKIHEDSLSNIQYSFTKSSILGADRDDRFNPKLLGSNYRTLRLSEGISQGKEYDLQKLGNFKSLSLHSVDVPTPDMSSSYVGFTEGKNPTGAYTEDGYLTYNGFVTVYNGSLPYTTDILDQYLANNKNFYMQRSLGYQQEDVNAFLKGIQKSITSMASIASGNPMSAIDSASEIGTAGISAISRKVNQAYDRKQSDLTLDNMRGAKDSLTNASGSPILNAALGWEVYPQSSSVEDYNKNYGPGYYLILEKALDFEILQDADVMFMYGFTYNRLGNIGDYDNIRKHFNYVQADIEIISAPISSLEEDRLKARFANGVRFWNSDTVQYTLENYETALEVTA